jgi:cytochrome c biogenesis protein CcdA
MMVALFFMVALLVTFSQAGVLAGLRDQTHRVKRWGGVVLIGVGGWLLISAVWAETIARILPV